MINITTTEAKLFAIRCGINQAIQIAGINHIIVVTDSLHTTHRIFDLSVHLYQIQLSVISRELREFFNKGCFNSIEFCDCSSSNHWSFHATIDKETKNFNISPLFSCKSSWNFDRNKEYDNILNTWKITFQASNVKGSNFLDLCNNEDCSIKPSYSKESLWIRYFGHSNSLCTRATRAIVNYAFIVRSIV